MSADAKYRKARSSKHRDGLFARQRAGDAVQDQSLSPIEKGGTAVKKVHLVEVGLVEAEAQRLALPDHVQLAMVEIAESAREGLLQGPPRPRAHDEAPRARRRRGHARRPTRSDQPPARSVRRRQRGDRPRAVRGVRQARFARAGRVGADARACLDAPGGRVSASSGHVSARTDRAISSNLEPSAPAAARGPLDLHSQRVCESSPRAVPCDVMRDAAGATAWGAEFRRPIPLGHFPS